MIAQEARIYRRFQSCIDPSSTFLSGGRLVSGVEIWKSVFLAREQGWLIALKQHHQTPDLCMQEGGGEWHVSL